MGDGTIHDDRSPDYDDWSTEAEDGSVGLNGDIIVWNPVLQSAFEISSMGIRVDRAALEKQLWLKNAGDRKKLYFHSVCSYCRNVISERYKPAYGPMRY